MIRKNPFIELFLDLFNLPVIGGSVKSDIGEENNKPKRMKQTLLQKGSFLIIFLTLLSSQSFGATKTWTAGASGSWALGTNWSGGTIPVAGDDIVINPTGVWTISNVPSISLNSISIGGSSTVRLTGNGATVITINNANVTVALNISAGRTLFLGNSTAASAVTITFQTITTAATISGTLTNTAASTITANVGTINVTGTISNAGTVTGVAASIVFAAGGTYIHNQNGGTIPTATWNATSNCNITGITNATLAGGLNQTFGNLNINCAGLTAPVTLTQSGAVTVQGNLLIQGTSAVNTITLNPAANALTVNGTTTINTGGFFNDNNDAGVNTFTGSITLGGSGGFTTINTTAARLLINGGIIQGSSSNFSTGTVTFGANQSISGAGAGLVTLGDVLIGNNFNVTNQITVNITNTLNGLNGSSTWSNANGSVLNYSGAGMPMTTGAFTVNTATNTVNYNAAGVQMINNTTYSNLTISGSGTKTLQGNTTVGNNLNVSAGTFDLGTTATTLGITGTATITGALSFDGTSTKTVTIGGNLSGAGTIDMSGGSLAHVLTLNGASNAITTFTAGSGTVIYSGNVAQQIFAGIYYNLTTQTNNQVRTIQGNITVNNNLTVTLGTFSFGNLSAMNVLVNGTLSGAGTIDISGSGLAHQLTLKGANNAISTFTAGIGSSTVIYSGTVAQQIFPGTYNNLTLNNASGFTLSGGVTSGGTLTMTQGNVTTGGNTFLLSEAILLV